MKAFVSQLDSLLDQWESSQSLLEPAHFADRMAVLDDLDRYSSGPVSTESVSQQSLAQRSRALSAKFEAINKRFLQSIRRQIQAGICPAEFTSILHDFAIPPRGVNYDHLDDLIAGVFQFEPPSDEPRALDPASVFYQPTPARHIFHLITAAAITKADTFIDLGSGLGHVPLLASISTGATSIGIELDPAWNASAGKCANALNLRSVSFLTQDAREADLVSGTVFYLYTPFTGATLASVLDSLRIQASLRPIRICSFGPCTISVSDRPWLKPLTAPAPDQITVFLPRA